MTKIVEKRSKPYSIGPSSAWIPDDVTNTLYDVVGRGSKVKIGDIEIGTDGFIQMIVKVDGIWIKLFKHPSVDNAQIIVQIEEAV